MLRVVFNKTAVRASFWSRQLLDENVNQVIKNSITPLVINALLCGYSVSGFFVCFHFNKTVFRCCEIFLTKQPCVFLFGRGTCEVKMLIKLLKIVLWRLNLLIFAVQPSMFLCGFFVAFKFSNLALFLWFFCGV